MQPAVSVQVVIGQCKASTVSNKVTVLKRTKHNPPNIKNGKKLLNYRYLTTVICCLAKVGSEDAINSFKSPGDSYQSSRRKSIDSAVFD